MKDTTMMTAARLHGPRDLRVEQIPHPGQPAPGEALIRVSAVGICGSDLHTYKDGRIGDSAIESPLILGHEFAGVVEAVGHNALDGEFNLLQAGTPVAVDPAQPCHHCQMCEQGHPNLCYNLHFCGLYPDPGSLAQWIIMPARTCFPLPSGIDAATGALLEPLGIALHAVDLAKIQVASSVAILGAGCIGLFILELAKRSGAQPIFISDKFPWRLSLAEAMGGTPINCDTTSPVKAVLEETAGRGVDIVIEAAWADRSVQEATEMVSIGGRMVVVGISEDDELRFQHSTVRRKGLTIHLARRMKHTYPRSMKLVENQKLSLADIISHRFPLEQAPEAFALNSAYADEVVKVIIDID